MRMKTPAGKEYEVILTTLQAIVLKVRRKMYVCSRYAVFIFCMNGFTNTHIHTYILTIHILTCICTMYIHTYIHTYGPPLIKVYIHMSICCSRIIFT